MLSGRVEWGPNNDVAYYSQNSDISEREGTVYDFFRRIGQVRPV